MNEMVDLDDLKTTIEGIGNQISTSINIQKERQRAETVEGNLQQQIDKIAGRNFLHNWYLINPVNQRRQTVYNSTTLAGTYTIDRWLANEVGGKITLTSSGVKTEITKDSQSGRFFQKLDQFDVSYLVGQTVTMSAIINGLKGNKWIIQLRYGDSFPDGGYIGAGLVPITSTGLVTGTVTIPSNVKSLWLSVMIDGSGTIGDYCTVGAIKLEVGDKQTLAHQDEDGNWILNDQFNYVDELQKCMYYQVYTDSPNSVIGCGVCNSTTNSVIALSCPPMRVHPIVTYNNLYLTGYNHFNESAPVTSTFNNGAMSGANGFYGDQFITSSGKLTPGNPTLLQIRGEGCWFLADANL